MLDLLQDGVMSVVGEIGRKNSGKVRDQAVARGQVCFLWDKIQFFRKQFNHCS